MIPVYHGTWKPYRFRHNRCRENYWWGKEGIWRSCRNRYAGHERSAAETIENTPTWSGIRTSTLKVPAQECSAATWQPSWPRKQENQCWKFWIFTRIRMVMTALFWRYRALFRIRIMRGACIYYKTWKPEFWINTAITQAWAHIEPRTPKHHHLQPRHGQPIRPLQHQRGQAVPGPWILGKPHPHSNKVNNGTRWSSLWLKLTSRQQVLFLT